MTPGTYVRLRRVKAGWKRSELAIIIAATPDDRPAIEEELRAIEADHIIENRRRVAQIANQIDLDFDIYLALVGFAQDPGSELPCPRICTGCGCTWDRPCTAKDGLCGWRDNHHDRCTACPPALD
ncbi:hypothetical protein [Croceicoccus sp. YJ47]|uniref:hypothetical protein n=1 Tax=Croceicoccus sp. YJ47 TaxID=2798724 RepID=UPI001923A4BD|nr:hypothetical protein [Croceicoccus sp. YJ47]QQN73146.1 hypothetical protein JD971_09715 [Croceicoccus sp. YJ47]